MKEHRTKELLEKFDEVTGELIYLSVPTEELQERITSIEKGRKGA